MTTRGTSPRDPAEDHYDFENTYFMGFMDELRKLTQPYDDEDDFFEGADAQYKPQPQTPAQAQPASREQALFESSFAETPQSQPQQSLHLR